MSPEQTSLLGLSAPSGQKKTTHHLRYKNLKKNNPLESYHALDCLLEITLLCQRVQEWQKNPCHLRYKNLRKKNNPLESYHALDWLLEITLLC